MEFDGTGYNPKHFPEVETDARVVVGDSIEEALGLGPCVMATYNNSTGRVEVTKYVDGTWTTLISQAAEDIGELPVITAALNTEQGLRVFYGGELVGTTQTLPEFALRPLVKRTDRDKHPRDRDQDSRLVDTIDPPAGTKLHSSAVYRGNNMQLPCCNNRRHF